MNELTYILTRWWDAALAIWPDKLSNAKMPTIEFNKRLTSTAGRAWHDRNYIDISYKLYQENVQAFEMDTIPHELAHIIACKYFQSTGHDNAWRYVYQTLTGKTPSRCHSYSIARDTFKYKCKCKEWDLSKIRHNRSEQGRAYFCPHCKGILVYNQ